MDLQLISTKLLTPPPRADLILRPRLVERLLETTNLRLILISAPPGYGKTSLAAGWLHGSKTGTAVHPGHSWLTLDETDNDPVRFFAYLAAAVQRLAPELPVQMQSLLNAPQLPPPEQIITILLRALEGFQDPGFLILDDYHVIHSPPIHLAMSFFLDHLPPNLHLVILSREDPPLPLPRLRIRRELVEIRESDLRFSMDEAVSFLKQTMRIQLSDETVMGLLERTEGWIAGLQMAALALQAGDGKTGQQDPEAFIASFRGDDRYVMDYLMEEVFRRQPEDVQNFLLQTAVLEQICAPLACAVIDPPEERSGTRRSCQDLLETLEASNLFLIGLDDHREWYRYHHLFADLLRYRQKRDLPERVPELHRRAALWFAHAGYPDEAMKHALSAGDHELAADVLEQNGIQMIGAGRIASFINLVKPIPDAIIFTRPLLCAGCGWAYVLSGQPGNAEKYVQAGEDSLHRLSQVQAESRLVQQQTGMQRAAGEFSAIRSFIARSRGDYLAAIEKGKAALAVLPAEANSIRCAAALNLGFVYLDQLQYGLAREALLQAVDAAGTTRDNVYAAVTALSLLGDICTRSGKLQEAERYFQRAVTFGDEESSSGSFSPARGVIHGWLTWLHFQRNEISEAQKHLDLVLQAAEQIGMAETLVRARVYQAWLELSRGAYDSAAVWLGRAEETAQIDRLPDLLRTEWMVGNIHQLLARGDIDSAAQLLASLGIRPSDLETAENEGALNPTLAQCLARYLALAHVLRAQGKTSQAAQLLRRILKLAEALPDMAVRLEALALLSTLQPKGLSYLQQALNLAAPEGYITVFLRAGSPLIPLVLDAIAEGIQPAFAHRLHTHLVEQQRQAISLPAVHPVLPLSEEISRPGGPPYETIEPLTEREKQVIRLLAAGLSSTQVAERLVISVSTARSYIKNIYAKLDAHNRADAVEKAAQSGYL